MVKNLPKQSKYEVLRNRLGARIESVIDIVNSSEFALALQNGGYKMSQNPELPFNFRGEKGNNEVYIDGSKRVFGVHAESIDSAITTIREMFSLINKSRDLELEKYISFYEYEITAVYHYGEDVYSAMSKLFQDSNDMTKLKQISGLNNTAQFTIKLTPAAVNINNPEWQEMTVEPRIESIGNLFHIRMICRSKELIKATAIAKRTEETATTIIEKVLSK